MKAKDKDMLLAGIRTAKRLGIRTQEQLVDRMVVSDAQADSWIDCLLAEDIRREWRERETLPAPKGDS